MSVTIFRPGAHTYTYGDLGTVQIRQRRSAGAAAADWWDLLPNVWAAYQPKGAASLAASLVDLSGHGHDAISVGADPAWDAVNGWVFAPGAKYLNSGFVPQNDQSQSVLIQVTNNVTTADFIFGSIDLVWVSGFYIVSWPGPVMRYANGNGIITGGASPAAGNVGIAGNQGYLNGAPDGTALPAWVVVPAGPCYIGTAWQQGLGVPSANVYGGNISAFAICDATESAPNMLAAATAMALL